MARITSPFKVRPYRDADYPAVKRALQEGELFEADVDTRVALRKKQRARPGSILVAEHQHEVIGVIYYVFDPWYSFLYRLAVRTADRKRGVATALLSAAERRLKAKGAKEIALLIREEEERRLFPFYQKRGWKRWPSKNQGLYKRL